MNKALRDQRIHSIIQAGLHGHTVGNALKVEMTRLNITGEFNGRVFDGYDHQEQRPIRMERSRKASY